MIKGFNPISMKNNSLCKKNYKDIWGSWPKNHWENTMIYYVDIH